MLSAEIFTQHAYDAFINKQKKNQTSCSKVGSENE